MKMEGKQNGKFAGLYLFSMKAKSTMAIYFMAFTIFYFAIGKFGGVEGVSLSFWTALQMMVSCMIIGFGQTLIVPPEKLLIWRGVLWVAFASAVTIGFALLFRWFEGFPFWCVIAFCGVTPIGFAALLLGLVFDTRHETQKLNEHLKEYQKRF
jgi:hypothetical protein